MDFDIVEEIESAEESYIIALLHKDIAAFNPAIIDMIKLVSDKSNLAHYIHDTTRLSLV